VDETAGVAAQEISSPASKVFADLGMPNAVTIAYNGINVFI
jgi:hypothetical protein